LSGTVRRRAAAKINLALHVVGRRADSYHLLDSIAVFADCCDVIEIARADSLKLIAAGQFAAHAPADRSDLAWRAADAFFAHTGLRPAASIHVEKNIPAGAGLGGGSADAAAVLLGLNEFLGADVKPDALRAIGLSLGADVPMCLTGRALRARGVGEEIAPIEGWPALPLVLVWPGQTVSTAEVFAALSSRGNAPLPELPAATPPAAAGVAQIAAWLTACRNDLEAPAVTLAPEISDVLAALRATEGCLLARMSGSGSACFGLYAEAASAEAAAAQLDAARPDWWVRATTAS
jgi:4-diphosphocytidyl-2-C-methyl-D-erythritol kinase